MRTATASELAMLAAASFGYSTRVLVKDTEAHWRNLSGSADFVDVAGVRQTVCPSTQGADWLRDYDLDSDIDQPVSQLTLSLLREFGATANLAQDGDFESGASLPGPYWVAGGGVSSATYETSTQYAGVRSLKLVITAQFGGYLSAYTIPAKPGELWSISAAMKTLAGKQADAQLEFLDAGGGYLGGVQPTSTSASWQVVSATGIAPAGTAKVQISLQCNDVGGGTIFFDAIDVRRIAFSLAPTRTDSLVNRKADGTTYQSIVDVGRAIRFEVAATYPSIDPLSPLVTDGGLETGSTTGWTLDTGWALDSTNQRTGGFGLKFPGAGSVSARNPFKVLCNPGDRLYVEAYFKGTGGANGTASARIEWYDAGNSLISASNGSGAASDGAYHLTSVLATAPANTAYARACYGVTGASAGGGTWYADDLTCLWASWKQLFDGVIDTVDEAHDPIVITARDLGGGVADRWTPGAQQYDYTASPHAIETVIQTVLDYAYASDPSEPTLYTPVSPSFNIKTFAFDIESTLDILLRLLGIIGWDLRFKWDDGTGAFRFTLSDPGRSKTTPDFTLSADQYIDIIALKIDRTLVRNRITVKGGVGAGAFQGFSEDSSSQTKYGLRPIVVVEASDSPINSNAEAQSMSDAMLADLKDPKADQTAVMLPYWPVELHDLARFSPNNVHYNANQDLAVVRLRHRGHVNDDGTAEHTTEIDTRGTPASANQVWIDRGRIPIPPGQMPAIANPIVLSVRDDGSVDATLSGNSAILSWRYAFSTSSMPSDATALAGTLLNAASGTVNLAASLGAGTIIYVKAIPFTNTGGHGMAGQPVWAVDTGGRAYESIDLGGEIYLQGTGSSSTQKLHIGTQTTPAKMVRTYRIPYAIFAPDTNSTTYSKSGGQLSPGTANVSADFWAALTLPIGATITTVNARALRNTSSDVVTVTLQRYSDGSGTNIAGPTSHATTGWTTIAVGSSLSETVPSSNAIYVVKATLKGVGAPVDAELAFVEIIVTVSDLNTGL